MARNARVTAQQFFDSSHIPWANRAAVGSNPERVRSGRFIQIYRFEVCTAKCNGEGEWLSPDQWLAQH